MAQPHANTGETKPPSPSETGSCQVGSPCWQRKVFLFLGVFLVYLALFVWALPHVEDDIVILAVIPASVAGWLFGVWGGALVGFLLILFNLFLFSLSPHLADTPIQKGLLTVTPALVALVITGAASGWVRQLVNRVNRQAAELRREQVALKREIEERIAAEAELAHIQQTLEQRIEQRTAELSRTNLQLQQEIAERRRVEKEVQQRNRLLDRIIELGNALYKNHDHNLSALLEDIVHSLGFKTAILNLVDLASESSQVRVRAIAGGTEEARRVLSGAEYRWDEVYSLFAEKYRLGRSYFIPAGEFNWNVEFNGRTFVPQIAPNPNHPREHCWHAEDMLLVPIRLSNGRDVGVLSVDEPLDGRRPNREALLPLEIFADRLAGVIENAQLHEQTRRELVRRMQAEENIKASLQEKEVLLKEIHHRVKNNLQIVSSLLNLQANYVQDPQILTLLKDSQNRIRSMAMVHEKLYRSDNLANINFADYIRDLAAYLRRSHAMGSGYVEVDIQAEEIFWTIEMAVPGGLILNELLSNAFKHAFPGGQSGKIEVRLRRTGTGETVLEIADNGPGLPAEIDFKNTDSLGLRLVNALTAQLGGAITLDATQGAVFTITLPPN